jgi:hypothetical protein
MQRISTRPMKKVVLAGILVVIGVLALGFAPLVPWSAPRTAGSDYLAVQVSPSWYLLKCGTAYNIGLVHAQSGKVDGLYPGLHWYCLNSTS